MKPSRKAIEDQVLALVHERGRGKTICPSEAARELSDDWRPLMDQVRVVADELAARGEIMVTQGGEVVSAVAARGPIRLGLR